MFSRLFTPKPSAIQELQAQTIEDLRADNKALRAELATLHTQHRIEMSEWRDAFAAIQYQSAPNKQISLLEEMQGPDEEAALPSHNFFEEFARVHGSDNADLVTTQEPK